MNKYVYRNLKYGVVEHVDLDGEEKSIEEVVIPVEATSISSNAFLDWTNLSRVIFVDSNNNVVPPYNLVEIHANAFKNTNISTFDVTTKLDTVYSHAFENTPLTSFNCVDGWPMYAICDDAFANTKLREAYIPSSYSNEDKWTKETLKKAHIIMKWNSPLPINNDDFEHLVVHVKNHELKSFFLSGSKTKKVEFVGDLKILEYNSLSQMPYIKQITIPEGVEVMKQCLYENPELASVTLPSTLKDFCFYNFFFCGKLNEINIPFSITSDAYHQVMDALKESLKNKVYDKSKFRNITINIMNPDLNAKKKINDFKSYSSVFIKIKFTDTIKTEEKDTKKQSEADLLSNEIKSLISDLPQSKKEKYIVQYNQIVDEYFTCTNVSGMSLNLSTNEVLISNLNTLLCSLYSYKKTADLIKTIDTYSKLLNSNVQMIENPINNADLINNALCKSLILDRNYYLSIKDELSNLFNTVLKNIDNEYKITLKFTDINNEEYLKNEIKNICNKVNNNYNENKSYYDLLNALKESNVKKDNNINTLEDNIKSLNYVFMNDEYKIVYDKIKEKYIKILESSIKKNNKDDIKIIRKKLSNELYLFLDVIQMNQNSESVYKESNINASVISSFLDDINDSIKDYPVNKKQIILTKANNYINETRTKSKNYKELYRNLASILLTIELEKQEDKDKIILKKIIL